MKKLAIDQILSYHKNAVKTMPSFKEAWLCTEEERDLLRERVLPLFLLPTRNTITGHP
jgi:hypothetical protein